MTAGRKGSTAPAFAPVARLHRAAAAVDPLAPVAPTATPTPSAAGASTDPQLPLLFLSESVHQSFFRRPAWSPDGGVLVLPSGQQAAAGAPACTAWLVTRNHLAGCVWPPHVPVNAGSLRWWSCLG
jgi:hypothetical protein